MITFPTTPNPWLAINRSIEQSNPETQQAAAVPPSNNLWRRRKKKKKDERIGVDGRVLRIRANQWNQAGKKNDGGGGCCVEEGWGRGDACAKVRVTTASLGLACDLPKSPFVSFLLPHTSHPLLGRLFFAISLFLF